MAPRILGAHGVSLLEALLIPDAPPVASEYFRMGLVVGTGFSICAVGLSLLLWGACS